MFAEVFRALRKEKGWTQEQLGAVLGVSAQAISRWENEVSLPDVTSLPAIASVFDVSTDTLLGVRIRKVQQKVLFFQVANRADEGKINEYLNAGWTIREMHTHPLDEGQHPEGVAILEKITVN